MKIKAVLIIYLLLSFIGRADAQEGDLKIIIQNSIDQQTLFPKKFLVERYHDQLIQTFDDFKRFPDTEKRYRFYYIILTVRNACSDPVHRIPLTKHLLHACGDPSRWIANHFMEMIDLAAELEDFDEKNIALFRQLFENSNVDVSRLFRIALDLPLPKQHQLIRQQFQELIQRKSLDIEQIDWRLFRSAKALASRGDEEAVNYLLTFANHQLASAEKGKNWMDVAITLERALLFVPQKRITNLFYRSIPF